MTDFIAKPKGRKDAYPWRPMDNRERRAAWAVRYYSRFRPYEHPVKEARDES